MRKNLTTIVGLLMTLALSVATLLGREDEQELAKQRQSLSKVREKIEELKLQEPATAASALSEILRKTTKQSIYQVEERHEVHRLAKEALLAIPGHAGFLVDEVNASRDLAKSGGIDRYNTTRSRMFETFKLLPSPEVVKVLGKYLDDDKDQPPPVRPDQDYSTYPANDWLAAKALFVLIEDPPVKELRPGNPQADIETWKLWYAQVEAGTRKFKFKGDDRIYSLSAPKVEAPVAPSAPEAISHGPLVTKQAPETREALEVAAESRSVVVPLLLSLAALGIATVWLYASKHRAKG